MAKNSIGSSDPSIAGTGSTIFIPVVPSAPTNLAKIKSGTTKTTASFSWTPGPTGGAFIIDYKISFDQSTGVWTDLAQGITGTSYQATGLTQGT